MPENYSFEVEKRLEIYEFFSYAFLNLPSEELINLIKEKSEYFKELSNESIDFIDKLNLEEITQEYYDRFFVPTSDLFVPPYESSIKNKKSGKGKSFYGPVDGKESFHVKACYELVDFKVNELNSFQPLKDNHYPDHIAFELAFMTYLINFELKALKNNAKDRASKWRKLQRDFLKDHISTWVGNYAELAKEKGQGLYSYISSLVANWIKIDLEYLMEEIE